MRKIVKKQICQCQNCGNEAEMIVTCSLPDVHEAQEPPPATQPAPEARTEKRAKGHATCTQCGNEADMWIDL